MSVNRAVVILAVDASKFSDAALDFYVDTLHGPDKQLIIVHCPEMTNLSQKGHMPNYDKWVKLGEQENAHVKEVQQKYQDKLDEKQISAEWEVVHTNSPGETIVEVARRHSATLIITGTRGMGSLRRTILGSVSDYVLRHATCPVVITRR